ncbi:hypothetical protein BC830DRAFT_1084993 [Chytriomyces sp. MP71]|nr:hypothetical protein BC830DRAFT_1084993 [Chytriomyces sp. MP71]
MAQSIPSSQPLTLPTTASSTCLRCSTSAGGQQQDLAPRKNSTAAFTKLTLRHNTGGMKEGFSKYGLITHYDALVTGFKEESVAVAVNLMDDVEFRLHVPGTRVRVFQAVFKEKERPAAGLGLQMRPAGPRPGVWKDGQEEDAKENSEAAKLYTLENVNVYTEKEDLTELVVLLAETQRVLYKTRSNMARLFD